MPFIFTILIGGTFGILFVAIQHFLASDHLRYLLAVIIFGIGVIWISYAILFLVYRANTVSSARPDEPLYQVAPLAIFWSTLFGTFWGLFTAILLRLFPAGSGRPGRPN
jgi:hypothetical protein